MARLGTVATVDRSSRRRALSAAPRRARVLPQFRRDTGRYARFAFVPGTRPPDGDTMPNFLTGGAAGYMSIVGWNPTLSRNPDEVAAAREGIYSYQEMGKNPYVKSQTHRVKAEILAKKHDVQAASDDPRDVEIADFVRFALNPNCGDFAAALFEMLECFDVGYSLTVPIWKRVDTGPWAGKWIIGEYRTKNSRDWRIIVDAYSQVLGYQEAWNLAGPIYLPQTAIRLSWDVKHGNPYGTAAYQCIRAAYEFLKYVVKQRVKYIEHYSKPARIGKAGSNDVAARQKFFEALKKWGDEFVMVTPDKGWDVDIVQAVSDEGVFQSTCEYFAREISIGLVGAHLHMMEGGSQGSRAAAETHADEASTPAMMGRQLLQREVNRQIVKQLVDWNYAGVTEYPEWVEAQDDTMSYQEIAALKMLMENVNQAVKMGLDVGQKWFRETFKIPAPAEDDILISSSSEGSGTGFASAGPLDSIDDGQDEGDQPIDEKTAKQQDEELTAYLATASPRVRRAVARMRNDTRRAEAMTQAQWDRAVLAFLGEMGGLAKKKASVRLPAGTRSSSRTSGRSGG
jgi:hypothetical protein